MVFIVIILALLVMFLLYLDLTKIFSLTHSLVLLFFFIVLPHIVILGYLYYQYVLLNGVWFVWAIIVAAESILLIFYIWTKLHLFPIADNPDVSHRLKIMMGGRRLALFGLFSVIVQTTLCIIEFINAKSVLAPQNIIIIDIIVSIISVLAVLANGIMRMLFTSRRLSIVRRIILLGTIYMPVINVIVILYTCHIVAQEYDHECNKVINHLARVDSQVCKTKYPLVMIHGVGFRDFKYINYWGRIPKALVRNGATVYYGNQEAWGTVEYNALQIKQRILEIIKETGCEKVNIISHSKGGLDARYLISELNMGDYVASLTTMSTPHRGSKAIDLLLRMPNKLYQFLAKIINRYFTTIGDKNPDFYTASKQFSTHYSKKFNECIKDAPQVYYQSYTTAMKNMFSDSLLFIPYCLVGIIEQENDGLVCIESAKWGEFKGVIRNKYRRGISHGDIIDLKREDYKGFDVTEKYIEIVVELAQMGY